MIRLRDRLLTITNPGSAGSLPSRHVWRVADPRNAADALTGAAVALLRTSEDLPCTEFPLHLTTDPDLAGTGGPTLALPPTLHHLEPGDIIGLAPTGSHVTVLWKARARHNSFLLTEQCDHRCVMCSQPPLERDDIWLFDRATDVIDLLPGDTRQIGLTGGEPTLHPARLLTLLTHLRQRLPHTAVHLLSPFQPPVDLEVGGVAVSGTW